MSPLPPLTGTSPSNSRLPGILAVTLLTVAVGVMGLKTLTVPDELGAQIRPPDHIGNFNFVIEIEGVNAGSFRSFSGLEVQVEVIEFRDGQDDSIVRKLPGRVRYGDITLKKGFIDDEAFLGWMNNILEGTPDRRTVNIRIRSEDGERGVGYTLHECWPKSWKISESVGGTVVPFEEVTLAVERFERS